ncbi:MAG: hypothetical protein JWR22_2828 [Herminiimonas sp.]|nr:hypothetical protein [Herminiimonas sp.]
MATITIKDPLQDQELDREAMAAVKGGLYFASRLTPGEPIRVFTPGEPVRVFTPTDPIQPTDPIHPAALNPGHLLAPFRGQGSRNCRYFFWRTPS